MKDTSFREYLIFLLENSTEKSEQEKLKKLISECKKEVKKWH